MDYDELFERATGFAPYPFQRRFAQSASLPDLLRAPTGAGKTATAVLGWLWRRRYAATDLRARTPRRLVFCLPMRSLVTQTATAAEGWLEQLGLGDKVRVYSLLGGAVQDSFDEHPDADAILIGTQDQLLSRALNRGYAVSRYRWPMQYALLNNDCLWVLDEVQLMGVGLSTSAQLQAFRALWSSTGGTHSVYMSATLDERLLDTVDARDGARAAQSLEADDLRPGRLADCLHARKSLVLGTDFPDPDDKSYAKAIATAVAEAHVPGTRSIVVLNRVARAQAVFSALDIGEKALLHSRFRPEDRRKVEREVLAEGWTGVLVATQAIEAGVDISSKTLFTELAPWPSLVQRFGRCNRKGKDGDARIVVIDLEPPDPGLPEKDLAKATADHAKKAAPYAPAELAHARELVRRHHDAAPHALAAGHPDEQEPAGPVIRRRDAYELFDTTADLNGRDLDVSRWIREADRAEVRFAWRDFGTEPSRDAAALHRDELCAVPIGAAKDFIKKATKKDADACWRWDSLEGEWQRQGDRLVPGAAYLLSTSAGGYDGELGWTGDPKRTPSAVPVTAIPQDDDQADRLAKSAACFVTLAQHSVDAREACEGLRTELAYDLPWDEIVEAAQWHDLGKAHETFQAMLVSALADDASERGHGPWAKSDGRAGGSRCERSHFRHELASALAMIEQGRSDLAAYLAACHHGKVRLSIRSRPTEKGPGDERLFALGVYDGDELPATSLGDGLTVPATTLRLDLMAMGGELRPSWTARALGLAETWGPFRLAMMETIVRVADWRASAKRAAGEEALTNA
ncbi:MAG: CRISPR-associated helicase Cas3' [Deltaproteobacteria bacterium]|nr:CRISPR-associated helicase Cas3' [Deltaproteobacteria bacterium]